MSSIAYNDYLKYIYAYVKPEHLVSIRNLNL